MFVTRQIIEVIVSAGILIGLFVVSDDDIAAPAPVPPQTLRDGFETTESSWQREYTDATIDLRVQDRSQRAAHGGRLSEHFQFETAGGSQFFVSYSTPRAPVDDDLSVSLFVRANRGGVQIFARVVLPSDIDPETKAPSFVMVPGTIFDQVDRWQKLEIVHMAPTIERLARVLRASSRRPVPLDGAYIEKVVVNLLGGPGQSEVFLDDLEISPVPKEELMAWSKSLASRKSTAVTNSGAVAGKGNGSAPSRIRLDRNLLEKRGIDGRWSPWLPTAIDAPGANIVKLRQAGYDIIYDDEKSDPERLRQAVDRGVLLMKRLSSGTPGDSPSHLVDQMKAYPLRQYVAFWQIGEHLGRQRELKSRVHELARFREMVSAVRGMDDDISHLVTATVDGELALYARAPSGLDILGIEPRMWGGIQSLPDNYNYLTQRKWLTVRSNLGGLFWAWIPAMTPAEVTRNIWGDDTPPSWGTPPVQPEQLRLMTYLALTSGYRGLGYRADADLTRPEGPERALWIEMSFLNLEIDLCEQILAENDKTIPVYSLFDPEPLMVPTNATQQSMKRPASLPELQPKGELRGAAIPLRDRKGALLLVADYSGSAQYQPPQMAADKITIKPVLPAGAQAFEISPGDVKVLTPERVPGGTMLTLEEFDTTSLILCTGDLGLYERVRAMIDQVRPIAVPLAIEQAEQMLQAVTEINGRLAADGHQLRSKVDLKLRRQAGFEGPPPDVPDLLAESQRRIKNARDAWERQDYSVAWAEARRARRPLRTVMSGHWEQASLALTRAAESINPEGPKNEDEEPKKVDREPKKVTNAPLLTAPISCPPLISFYTLPEHYIWVDWIKGKPGYRFGRNRVPSGSFDDRQTITASGWVDVSYQMEGIKAKISIIPRSEANAVTLGPNRPSLDQTTSDNRKSNYVVKLTVSAERPEELDTLLPKFLDFPVAAIRSPPIRVEANNLIRISVLVRRPYTSPVGTGGIFVRDSIGGEQFQYRTSMGLGSFSRVVLFRKAPADGTFWVTLGLAGYAEAYFDDFRVQVIEHENEGTTGDSDVAQARPGRQAVGSPRLPDSTLPTATARSTDSRPR
jgi:hypothetical protein